MLLANKVTSLFDDMFREPFFTQSGWFDSVQMMKTDVKEKDGNYLIDMELPGYAREDIQAELKDGYLTIAAARNESKDEKDEQGNYIRRERYTGSCKRSFYVGKTVRQEDIKAAFQDGILRLVIPKTEAELSEKGRYIAIE